MKEIKTISIKCECENTLELSQLSEFQGGLKIRNDEDIDLIVKSIKELGFSIPFNVWKHNGKNLILDGHGRYSALKKLDELGYIIPPLPVVYVKCKNEQSARDLLLRINSSYGKLTKESVLEFIGDFEIDTSNYELPCGTIDFTDNVEEIPEELKPVAKKEISCKIVFDSSDDLSNFLERYKADIQDEYSCLIKINCEE